MFTYQVDTGSPDTRILETLVNILLTRVTSESVATLTREATACLHTRGSIEARSGLTLGNVLLTGDTSPPWSTGAGEGGGIVGAQPSIAAGLASAVVQGAAASAGLALCARWTHALAT